MAIIYICDSCKKEFQQALDKEVQDGISLDLCAKCRTDIKEDIKQYKVNKFKQIKKGNNEGNNNKKSKDTE